MEPQNPAGSFVPEEKERLGIPVRPGPRTKGTAAQFSAVMFKGIEFVVNPRLQGWRIRRLTDRAFEVSFCVAAFARQLRAIGHVFDRGRQ
jgi:hypothetical protein